eukprot:CAMPEP_0198698420 /NCGR_PEP_ID=MMETSP1468-20131203/337564_1 /TAXON_ID=1461545 /ORGANISM="Mantoniella sp, Strain CCMP1436" /LENGTH=147 /DNA_ID=CAMNT_0044455477 /DNA_START=247 /DNA_END=686 /DNA_ORIENTATION=+
MGARTLLERKRQKATRGDWLAVVEARWAVGGVGWHGTASLVLVRVYFAALLEEGVVAVRGQLLSSERQQVLISNIPPHHGSRPGIVSVIHRRPWPRLRLAAERRREEGVARHADTRVRSVHDPVRACVCSPVYSSVHIDSVVAMAVV